MRVCRDSTAVYPIHRGRFRELNRNGGFANLIPVKIRKGLIGFIAVFQSVVFLTHFLLYKLGHFRRRGARHSGPLWLKLAVGVLSVSFLVASLLAFRWTNSALRALYRVAAVWLGMLTFLFLAAVSAWIVFGLTWLAGLAVNFHWIVEVLFGIGVVAGLYGVLNANCTRITRTTVRIANLPDTWRGRRAALISDVHLGHVRNGGFLRRMVTKILKEEPDLIFIAGDLFDGTAIDARRAAEPLKKLRRHTAYILSRAITSNLGTTANICTRSRPPGCACSTMRRWKRTACRLLVFRSGMRHRMVASQRSCTTSAWIAAARASYSHMRPTVRRSLRPRAFPSSYPAIPTLDNLYPGVGWRGECIGNLYMA